MRVTKRLFTSVCPAALMAALAMVPAMAQSTGTQDMETVTVTGVRTSLNGLMNAAPLAKETSVITSEFLKTQHSGQTVFQSLNFMPGVNFTNNDPYGTSGGNIRIHGQDGAHVSLTLDGMPLNDTGNYAVYSGEMVDPEVIDRVSVLQGATDVDSPTAAATGGVIAITTDKPHDEFGAMGSFSMGEYSMQRFFARVDTGKFGPFGTSAFGAFSYQGYDKFKGDGKLRKLQGNLKLYQDMGDLGWFSLFGNFDSNRNNNYYSSYYVPSTAGFTAALSSQVEVVKDGSNTTGYGANPLFTTTNASFSADGFYRDYTSQCVYNRTGTNNNSGTPTAAPVSGVTDYTMTTCGNYYKTRINPSDNGSIIFASLWHVLPHLTMTVDAGLYYVLATGGTTTTTFSETAAQLIGSTTGVVSSATTTTPYGCIAGKGCDLNGDGDIKDTVEVQSPSVTNTRRWSGTTSLIYELTEDQKFQAAYTIDWGLHVQTGRNGLINGLNGDYNPFGPVAESGANAVLDAGGTPVRYRDRKSYAVMNQAAFDWEGNWLDGMVKTSLGFRMPFLERRLNQHCYEVAGSSTAYCTSQAMGYYNTTMNYYTLSKTPGTTDTKYVGPSDGSGTTSSNFDVKKTLRYSRFLPHLGTTFEPFGKENQFFGTYTQEIAAPKTDNLYNATHAVILDSTTPYVVNAPTKPETSTTYQLGYRYLGEDLQTAVILWNSQIRNRIVSSYDPITSTYYDHNVPGVNFSGFDVEANYRILDGLTAYANAGYTHARITSNIQVQKDSSGNALYAQTLNKQLSETPKWTMSGRVTYDITGWWNVGVGAKYVSRRNQSEDNHMFVPDYWTANFDMRISLDDIGLTNSDLRFNVDNVFNKHYWGSLGTVTCFTPDGSTPGCTSLTYAYVGAPRTFSTALVLRF